MSNTIDNANKEGGQTTGKVCLAVDNYFMSLEIILSLCEMEISIVSTACFQNC